MTSTFVACAVALWIHCTQPVQAHAGNLPLQVILRPIDPFFHSFLVMLSQFQCFFPLLFVASRNPGSSLPDYMTFS
jgi:hypothetical protein